MKERLSFLFRNFLYWLIVFWIFKFIFLLYHSSIYAEYSFTDLFNIFLFGGRLDVSTASYLTVLPGILIACSSFTNSEVFKKIIRIYTFIVLFLVVLLSLADLEIFKWWGFKIDSSLLKYFKTPQEVYASMAVAPGLPHLK
ncbi:MAG: hypothetical protein K2X86_13590 [Cytophagaceae bacterium]|nr:hypothetical protein [Cytophagaceae bacterium]